jgi:DNA-binding CsgD family transcriptional regulator
MARRQQRDKLTPREREVLSLLRRGLTNEEIAGRLGISVAGAKYHVSQILSRLGVSGRDEAASLPLDNLKRRWAGWPLWVSVAAGSTAVVTSIVAFALVMTHSNGEQEMISVAADTQIRDGPRNTAGEPDVCNWAQYDGPAEAGWDVFLGCGVNLLYPSFRGESCLWEAMNNDAVVWSWLSEGRGCGWRGNLPLRNQFGACLPAADCSLLLPRH